MPHLRAVYRTWVVAPQPGDLRWAKGAVPTPYGDIKVGWTRLGHGGLRLRIEVPRGTSGHVVLPSGRGTVTVPVRTAGVHFFTV